MGGNHALPPMRPSDNAPKARFIIAYGNAIGPGFTETMRAEGPRYSESNPTHIVLCIPSDICLKKSDILPEMFSCDDALPDRQYNESVFPVPMLRWKTRHNHIVMQNFQWLEIVVLSISRKLS
jgi:hypothetical protein